MEINEGELNEMVDELEKKYKEMVLSMDGCEEFPKSIMLLLALLIVSRTQFNRAFYMLGKLDFPKDLYESLIEEVDKRSMKDLQIKDVILNIAREYYD